jgi:hypothetical protein
MPCCVDLSHVLLLLLLLLLLPGRLDSSEI